jgi:hypothetical protein
MISALSTLKTKINENIFGKPSEQQLHSNNGLFKPVALQNSKDAKNTRYTNNTAKTESTPELFKT